MTKKKKWIDWVTEQRKKDVREGEMIHEERGKKQKWGNVMDRYLMTLCIDFQEEDVLVDIIVEDVSVNRQRAVVWKQWINEKVGERGEDHWD